MRYVFLAAALSVASFAVSLPAQAQGIPGGVQYGASRGNQVAGPVGAVVGGVVGGAVGGVEGALGITHPAPAPMPVMYEAPGGRFAHGRAWHRHMVYRGHHRAARMRHQRNLG